jgi:UDP-N-acetylmuramoylalanine--D-glutamate ligase
MVAMDLDSKSPESDYRGKTVLVVGAARSGIAATLFLLARGARVVLTDSKGPEVLGRPLGELRASGHPVGNLVLELGGHRVESFRSCDLVVVSPGVPLSLPYFEASRKQDIPILAEVELASRHLKGKLLGITGSNGKTTVTVLTAELLRGAGLRAHAAGNVGAPLIGFVEDSTPEDCYATELSSFQLEGIREMRPTVASILNLTPDHMDRYPGFDDYIAAKERIFMNQTPADYAVLNADDPRTATLATRIDAQAVFFTRRIQPLRGVFLRGTRVLSQDGNRELDLFSTEDIRLKGGHNVENVLASCAIALLAGAAPECLRDVIRGFRGVEHRLEWVAEIDGVQYFNDSKATNVDATVKSLEAFPSGIHLIAGGRDKGGDFSLLRPLVVQRVKEIVLIGEAAGKIREALKGAAGMSDAASLPEAIRLCRRAAVAGDVVLLAPACASFDMFQDYEHRGRVFKDTVRSLSPQD